MVAADVVDRRLREHQVSYLRGKPKLVHLFFRAAISRHLDALVITVIIANTITLSMDYYGASPGAESMLNAANAAFTAVFATEVAVKLIGTRCRA